MMEHSRARDVARAGLPHGEPDEGTTSQRPQGHGREEPDQGSKGDEEQKLEVEKGIEIPQDVEGVAREAKDRTQAGCCPRP